MSTTFHMLKGMLRVAARGFWHTGGGEKGSFGYHPHLKNSEGLPVYPDTQLHGDLLMAARWAKALGVDGSQMDRLFGRRGDMSAALLHLGDLTVASAWKWEVSRFHIKPRVEIDDETRTVKDHMLANFEAAWLDGLTLEAPIHAGYFTSRDELKTARQLLDEAARLLSGFGAMRSRGYGRGTVSLCWDDPETATIAAGAESAGHIAYNLTSLVNLRSKPVAAEQLKLVSGSTCITADQLRGWFVRSYRQVTGNWPDADEMAGIRFSDLYPSTADEVAYPPPMTTLRKEDGTSVDDYWGRPAEGEDDNENFVKCKLKPLKPGTFVTSKGKFVEAALVTRMRNAMEDGEEGGDFRTRKEGGLFVQQHLESGANFGGTLRIADPQSPFGKLAGAIIDGLKPTINGCLFSAKATPFEPALSASAGASLVTAPLTFDPARVDRKEQGSVTIGTGRRYSPVLGRPRRGRPVILPGSVLTGADLPGTVAWPLLGKNIPQGAPEKQDEMRWVKPDRPAPMPKLNLSWKDITRSQAGILRELLNPDHDGVLMGKFLKDLRDKHTGKNSGSDPSKLYGALVSVLENEGIDRLRSAVTDILDYLKIEVWWEGKKNKAGRVAK